MNMNNQDILLLQLLMVSWNYGLGHAVPCWEGEWLHTPADPQGGDVCLPCGDGTFMAETNHWNRKCNECSQISSPLEIVITACNKTHDTEIQCVPGYYRRRAQTALENDTCEECRTCESGFTARPCLGYNDTVCCPLQHDAVWTCEGKYECQERPAACGAGMYYNTSFDTCLSCPHGTYMQAHYHTTRECVRCEALSGNSSNHAVILQPCTRTSATVFGCEDFHFRESVSGSLLEEAPCRPCQTCSRYLRQCHILHDAVCAEDSHDDDNTSEDTGTGDGQTAGVPESCPVTPPTQTSSYQINILLVGEMLLYLLHSCMRVVMRVYNRREGFRLGSILREVPKLYRDYYLSLFIVSILLRALIFLYYNGYFGGFAQHDISTTLFVVSGITSVVYFLYLLLSNYIKDRLQSFWGMICSRKRRIQNSVNRWLIARKDKAGATREPQAESLINNPPSLQNTTAM